MKSKLFSLTTYAFLKLLLIIVKIQNILVDNIYFKSDIKK